jgi:hypothetical protein
MQPDDHLRDVLRSLSPRPAETPLDRALRDGGDSPRDPDAPDAAALDLVRRAALSGDPFIGPRLPVEPIGPAPRSSDPLVNEALGAYDASDVFKVSFTNRYGVL